ncbi:MAG: helix-turn-helix domain-containing protein [Gemmatimonadetes bacterium]|nr:helix-turn-helix domain-containing protein [Gemmatimonadota bacterium]
MTRHGLGDFEQLVLLAMLQIGEETYGVPIVEEIERRTGRGVSRAAVYVALRRLERKGLVRVRLEETGESPGKPRSMVRFEAEALERLRESRRAMTRMSSGLEGVLE